MLQRGQGNWPRRMWLALSIANVWASGVATAHYDWAAVAASVLLAFACWWLSDLRVTALFARVASTGEERDPDPSKEA